MNYRKLQDMFIQKYRMNINTDSKCYSRTHVHPKKRMICKWKRRSSVISTFTLLHEIGHCENNDSTMRRCEQEYYATVWALERCEEYHIEVPQKEIAKCQRYIWNERQRGINRHCNTLPSKEELTLRWYKEGGVL